MLMMELGSKFNVQNLTEKRHLGFLSFSLSAIKLLIFLGWAFLLVQS